MVYLKFWTSVSESQDSRWVTEHLLSFLCIVPSGLSASLKAVNFYMTKNIFIRRKNENYEGKPSKGYVQPKGYRFLNSL